MDVLFSIIVPVYNVHEYLDECIHSILNQTYQGFELILVDDGSTDNSGEIADSYKQKDKRVIVIHRENGGLSAARNTGMNSCKGDYIVFVDSDDCISPDALEVFSMLIKQNQNPDIISLQGYALKANGELIQKIQNRKPIEGVMNGIRFLEIGYKNHSTIACAPLYIYNGFFLRNSGIKFEEGIYHEDELWTPSIMYKAQRVVDGNHFFYFHRQREGSITHSKNKLRNAEDLIKVCYLLKELVEEYESHETKWMRNRIAMLYMNAIFYGGKEILKKNNVDRKLPLHFACSIKNRIKAFIFYISPTLYLVLDQIIK